MIKLYTQLLEEMTARFGSNGDRRSEEPAALLSRTPRTKEEENDLLKVSFLFVNGYSKAKDN